MKHHPTIQCSKKRKSRLETKEPKKNKWKIPGAGGGGETENSVRVTRQVVSNFLHKKKMELRGTRLYVDFRSLVVE